MKTEFGGGVRYGTIRIKLAGAEAPRDTIVGVQTDGRIWWGVPKGLRASTEEAYRAALARIPAIEDAARTMWWSYLLPETEGDVAGLRAALETLLSAPVRAAGRRPSGPSQPRVVRWLLRPDGTRVLLPAEDGSTPDPVWQHEPFRNEGDLTSFLGEHPWILTEAAGDLLTVLCDPKGSGGPDLVCVDRGSGRRHVVETKLGPLRPEAITQVLSYAATFAWSLPVREYARFPTCAASAKEALESLPDDKGLPVLYAVGGDGPKSGGQIPATVRCAAFAVTRLLGAPPPGPRLTLLTLGRWACPEGIVAERREVVPDEGDVGWIWSWNRLDDKGLFGPGSDERTPT